MLGPCRGGQRGPRAKHYDPCVPIGNIPKEFDERFVLLPARGKNIPIKESRQAWDKGA